MTMTTAEQAAAVVAEFTADASKQSHKMATGFRGEVSGSFNGTEYRCVRANGRVNWYVGGKLTSVKNAVIALAESLQAEHEAMTTMLSPKAQETLKTIAAENEAAAKALAEVEKAEAIARAATAGRVSGYYSFEVDGVEWSVRDADGMLWTRNGKRISRVNVLRQLAGLA